MLVCPLCRIVLGSAEVTCPRDGREGTQVEIEPVPSELAERFRVLEVFAAGQAGTLYLADEAQTGRRGILKIIRSASHVAPDRVRLKRELLKQANLSAPSLMVPLVTGEAGNVPWLFREWRDGVSLRVRLARGGALGTPEALAVIAQITSALDELHRAGLQHRDLKPGHVLLQPQPSGVPRVHVIDAGIGQRIEAEGGFDIVGTPTYVSPEEVTGQLVSFRSDLYALGCLMYELLVGRPPFEADTTAAQLQAHVERPIPEAPGGLPTGLASLLFSLLAKEPRERPFSAQQVRRALEPFLPEGGTKRDPTVGFEDTGKHSVRPLKGRAGGTGTLRPPPSIRPTLTGMPSVPAPADLLSKAAANAAKAEAEAEAAARAAAQASEAVARAEAEPAAAAARAEMQAQVEAAAEARAEAEVTAPDGSMPSPTPTRGDDTQEVVTFEVVDEPVPPASASPSPVIAPGNMPQRSVPPPLPTRSVAPARLQEPDFTPPVNAAEAGERRASLAPPDLAPPSVGQRDTHPDARSRPAVVGMSAAAVAFGAVVVLGGGYWLFTRAQMDRAVDPGDVTHGSPPAASEGIAADDRSTALPPITSVLDGGAAREETTTPVPAPTQTTPTTPAETPEDIAAADQSREEARTYFREQRYAEAVAAYTRATELQPTHAGSFAGLGASKLEAGDARGAVAAYQRAVQLAPEKSGFSAALGRAYLQAGDRVRAIESYERALTLDANNGAAREALTRLQSE